jgi:hypothetical protein
MCIFAAGAVSVHINSRKFVIGIVLHSFHIT